MIRYRVTQDVPKPQPYEPGQVVDVPPGNRGIWQARTWAVPVREKEVERATATDLKREVEAHRVGDSHWYEIRRGDEVLEKVQGSDARDEALRRHA